MTLNTGLDGLVLFVFQNHRQRRILLLITLFILFGGWGVYSVYGYTTVADCTQQISSWQQGAPAPGAHLEGASAVVNGKLYLIAGFMNSALNASNRVDAYDPATNTWQSSPTYLSPSPFTGSHVQGASDGRNIWLVGGFVGNTGGPPTNQVWRYDTVTNIWSAGPSLPQSRASGATVVVGRTLHYFGGIGTDRQTNQPDHWVLNLDNPTTWTQLAPLPRPRNHIQAVSIDGLIYIAGGQVGHDGVHSEVTYVDIYDSVTNTWRTGANLGYTRSHNEPGTIIMNDRLVLVAGRSFSLGLSALNRVTQYNPQTNSWAELTPLPLPLYEVSAGYIGNRLIVTAGGLEWNQPQFNTYIGNVTTNCVLATQTTTTVSATTETATATSSVTATVSPTPAQQIVYRINSGGALLTTSGVTWSADQYYVGGYNSTMQNPIAGTEDDTLYVNGRTASADLGSFNYNFPVSAGQYLVRLHFAETYFVGGAGRGTPGTNRRIFDVTVEGALVLDNYDIYAAVGALRPDIRAFQNINVTDGTLNINFAASINRPLVAAIEIIRLVQPTASPVPPANQPPLANAGVDQTVTDSDNNGTHAVSLNGSGSIDLDGSIASYSWAENTSVVGTGVAPSVNLSVGVHTITLTVTDNTGSSATDTVVITVQTPAANQAPVVTNPGNRTNAQGIVVSLQISASDPNGHTLRYAATGLPTGLTININTGLISGTLTSSQGTFPVTVTVTDNGTPALSTTTAFNWTVSAPTGLAVTTLSLINAGTDTVIGNLTEGTVINLATLPGGFNVRANATSTSGSIAFRLNGAAYRTENYAPFTLFGDGANGADYYAGNLGVGSYTLAAIPYSSKNLAGTVGVGVTVNFTIINQVPIQGVPSAVVEITANGTLDASTFTSGFSISNTSTGNLRITAITYNLSAAMYPGLVFDPLGGAGDTIGRCFTVVDGASTVGFVTLANACSTPFSGLIGNNGYTTLNASFNNFDPGEIFNFAVDVDPSSITGSTASGGSGNVSGLEMTGTTISVTFNNGTTLTGEVYRIPNSSGGGRAVLTSPLPTQPTIEVLGVSGAQSNIYSANQTVRLSGAAGSTVSLLVVESGLLGATVAPANAFVANQALAINEYSAVIGAGGTVDVPLTLVDGSPSGTLYYLTAVIRGTGNSTSATSNVIVLNWLPNTAPTITNPGDQSSIEGVSVNLSVIGSDIQGAVTFSAIGLPGGLSINPTTGVISGTIAIGTASSSPYSVTITVTDSGGLTASAVLSWIVTNSSPIITTPADQMSVEGAAVSLQIVGSDAQGAVTFSATGLPDGLSIVPGTGLISGTVANGAAANSPYTVTVMVTDSASLTVSATFTWSISLPNTPPTITSPGDQSNIEGDSLNLTIAGSDAQGVVTFSASGLPSGLGIDPVTGIVSGMITVGASSSSPYSVTVTVTDSGGLTASATFNWLVSVPNTLPTITNPGDQTNLEGAVISLSIVAGDAEGAVTFSATGLPAGLSIDPTSGMISGTVETGAATASPYSVTVTVTDSGGLTAAATFNWLISS